MCSRVAFAFAQGKGIAFGDEFYMLPEAAKTVKPGFARWKCTPLGAAHHFPRRGKFALRSALGLISTSMHSTAKSSPSGVAKELDSQGADRRLRIQ